jgi:hypothetical protein
VLVSAFEVRRGKEESIWKERRIALETATMLDAKEPIYPMQRFYATPAVRGAADAAPAFASDCRAASSPDSLLHVDEKEILAALVDAPLPDAPLIALRARFTTTIPAEIIVSERGDVECVRARSTPFGIAQDVIAALQQWRFRPFRVDGHPVKAVGSFLFRLTDVDEAEWQKILVPPFRLIARE